MSKVCAVIPAYNEESALGPILRKVKERHIDAIVVDDGSIDDTRIIAENEGTFLIRHPANRGKGRALRSGFQLALTKGYDLIITLDADGQHDQQEIPLFIKEIEDGEAGVIVGNRLRHPIGMPAGRLFVNKFFSRLTSKVCGQDIPDALCGYRVIKKEVLKNIVLKSDRFDIDPEILIKAAKAGFKIGSVDITCIYGGEASHISPIRDGKNFFRLVSRELKNV